MHFPLRPEEGVHVGFSEKFRRAVGAVEHADLPHIGGAETRRLREGARLSGMHGAYVQHVARAERPSAVAAETPEDERRAAPHVERRVDAAANGDVGPLAAGERSALEHRPFPGGQGDSDGNRDAVDPGAHVRPGERNDRFTVEPKARSLRGDLEPGRVRRVADGPVGQAEAERVHRPRRRRADGPIAQPAGVVLHGGLRARSFDLYGRGVVFKAVEQAGGVRSGGEVVHVRDLPQQQEVGFEPGKARPVERPAKRRNGFRPVRPPHDELREQRVVKRRDLGAAPHPAIAAHAIRKADFGQHAGARLKIPAGVFRVDPRLNRRPSGYPRRPVHFGALARREPDHPFHEVYSEHGFGDAMLHLEAGVHFKEIELPGRRVENEFHGAGGSIGDARGEAAGRFVEGEPRFGGEPRRGSLLDDLLVAALHGAVPLSEGERFAPPVAEHLHFDVASPLDELFEEYSRVAEIVPAEPLDALESRAQLFFAVAAAHADAAPSGGAFQHHRVSYGGGRPASFIRRMEQPGAREERRAAGGGDFPRAVLEAEITQLLGRGADKDDPPRGARLREFGVFAQKAVAGMNRFHTRFGGDGKDFFGVEITLPRRGRPDGIGFIRFEHMAGARVRLRIDGDRGDFHPPQGADDAAGDFPTIGDQHFPEHDVRLPWRFFSARSASGPGSDCRRCRGY